MLRAAQTAAKEWSPVLCLCVWCFVGVSCKHTRRVRGREPEAEPASADGFLKPGQVCAAGGLDIVCW